MSFILDRLKKSGKQRALEMAMLRSIEKPGSETAEPLLLQSADRTFVSVKKWKIAAGAVLLGTFAVYGGVAFLSQTSPLRQPVVQAAKGLVQGASQMPAAPLSVFGAQIPDAPVQEGIASDAKRTGVQQKKTGAVKAVEPMRVPDRDRDASEQAGAERSTDESRKRLPAARIDAPIGAGSFFGSVLEFKQLPLAVRKSLPEIRITSHLYRKDSRLVSINGRIMSEGFNMDDGLYLEEITPEGVVLSFRSHRFSVRAD